MATAAERCTTRIGRAGEKYRMLHSIFNLIIINYHHKNSDSIEKGLSRQRPRRLSVRLTTTAPTTSFSLLSPFSEMVSDFDNTIEGLTTWDAMLEWINVSPTYRCVYLFCAENEIFRQNMGELSIKLPPVEWDKPHEYCRVYDPDEKCGFRVEKVGTLSPKVTPKGSPSTTPRNSPKNLPRLYNQATVLYEDEYKIPTKVIENGQEYGLVCGSEVMRVFKKNYWRLGYPSGREGDSRYKMKTVMASNSLYAWYQGDKETMTILLEIENQMTSLMASEGDLKYLVYSEYVDKTYDASEHIDHFPHLFQIDEYVRLGVSRKMLENVEFMNECFFRDAATAMKMLNQVITPETHLPRGIIEKTKAQYLKDGANLLLRTANVMRYVKKHSPEFVGMLKKAMVARGDISC